MSGDSFSSGQGALHFGTFELDLENRRLSQAGRTIEIGSRYFDALALLAASGGALVTKDRFMDEVWRGIPVTDEALTQCIRTLRRALGDEAGSPRFIATVPKHGYRFVAPVRAGGGGEAPGKAASNVSRGGRIAGSAALGGLVAGLAGGLVYGLVSIAGGPAGGGSGALVLVALGGVLGLLGGAGVGLGMAAGTSWRPDRRWPLVLGGGCGGMTVGALGAALGSDGVALVTGVPVRAVTGLFEGLLLGLACGAGLALFAGLRPTGRALAGGALLGLGAGKIIALAGGRLLGGSLIELEQRIPSSQIGLARALDPFGDWLAPLEALVFVTVILAAERLSRRRYRQ